MSAFCRLAPALSSSFPSPLPSFLPSSSLTELCETWSHYVAQALVQLTVLQPQPLNARILGCITSYTWLIVVFKYLICYPSNVLGTLPHTRRGQEDVSLDIR